MFTATLVILTATFVFTENVTVLKDWTINLPTQPIHAGDTINVQSVYTKLRPLTGTAERYVDCKGFKGGYIRYLVNKAVANRAPAVHTGTGIVILIPMGIPDLPTQCHISIVVTYQVYPWRAITQFNQSKDFTLLPSLSPVTSQQPAASAESSTASNPIPVAASSTGNIVSPSSNPTSTNTSAQPNTSQSQAAPPSNPGVIRRVLNILGL